MHLKVFFFKNELFVSDTFRKLKQRVVWKFEDESISNLPENVLIRKWLPQIDILTHSNLVLFISHGGMFSNMEAVKYGVQMVMIPIAGDQHRNAQRVEKAGYGKVLAFNDITDESLHSVLNEMLTDDKYSRRAKEISAVFNNNVVHPMDEFVFWIEHVIKFRDAKHLKSHAANMSLFSYLLVDVIAVNLALAAAIIISIYFVIKRCCSKKRNNSTKTIKKVQ